MSSLIEVKVPDIGGYKDVPVIEIAVKAGDRVEAEESLLTLESDKATMDVPSPSAGVVKEVKVKIGDKVAEGSLIVVLEGSEKGEREPGKTLSGDSAAHVAALASLPVSAAAPSPSLVPRPSSLSEMEPIAAPMPVHIPTAQETAADVLGGHKAHASPSVRAFARELGADIGKISGNGPKGRITREDVVAFVKGIVSMPPVAPPMASGGSLNLLPWPQVDFAKFGPIETRPLSRIKKISGANLARNWAMIPHVTQFDEADITDLEAFRVRINKENERHAATPKLTMLAFIIKACVAALKRFPEFNASLDGDTLVLKQYVHIGFAADTPNGLVVPVIRDADRKGVLQLAAETAELAKKARDGKIGPAEMSGGCFSISSLGGIGGTAFTPIINAPEVAILGVSKTQLRPVWNGESFVPRQMLPLSLSYDHRVIDGAAAARFVVHLGELLADLRRATL
ncbi:MAG: dihydrolipoyllysine-residue acetyltransferase [Rhodocyclaceae bacterium]|jgi:pyruvate dehydrogenase E2 component (dihydrolipoamide acetyltransferase)|nr:dihydrolipoyllysine-residue acetyltransferase [Rhodocyclaceae bacterium]